MWGFTGLIESLDVVHRPLAKADTSKMERHTTTALTLANRAAALTYRLLVFSRRQPLNFKRLTPIGLCQQP